MNRSSALWQGSRGLLAILAVVCVVAGCAELTARHLDSRHWNPQARQTLDMRHWRFDFISVPTRDSYGVKGTATALADTLPAWVDRVQELTLTAYLRDAAGTVLAQDEKTYLPMSLADAKAVSFDFFLVPRMKRPDTSLSVSFGYRTVFTSTAAVRAAAGGNLPSQFVFFAGEAALVRE